MQKTRQALLLILVIIFSVSFLTSINAQSIPAKTIIWNKTYGPVWGQTVLPVEDGGYVIAGTNGKWEQVRGPGHWANTNATLIKIDSKGNEQWRKNYTIIGDITTTIQTNDNGFALLIGRNLCKMDSQGNLQWNKTYDAFAYIPNYYNVFATSIIQTNDDGFLMCGFGGSSYWDGRLVKTDSEGNLQWSKTYGETNGASSKIYSILETNDGYVFAGHISHLTTGQQNSGLVKVNLNGDVQWEKGYGDEPVEYHSLIKSSDGGFVFTGYHNSSSYVFKVDSTGNLQWKQEAPVMFSSIAQTKEGGYIFAGSTGNAGIVSKYSASGKLQWTQNFENGEDPSISSIAVGADGSYVFTGSKGLEQNTQIWAFKIPYDNLPAETFTPTSTQTVTPSSTLQAWAVPLTVLIVIVAFIAGLTVLFKRKKTPY